MSGMITLVQKKFQNTRIATNKQLRSQTQVSITNKIHVQSIRQKQK